MQEQTLDQQAFIKKAAEFQKEIEVLQEKYGIAIMPQLQFTPFGIVPQLQLMDRDQLSDEMKLRTSVMTKTQGTN